MDLRRQISIVRTWLPLLIASVVLAAGAAFVISNLQPKVYEAKATLIVGQSLTGVNPDYTQLLASQRLSTTYAALATTRPILEAVIEGLGLDMTPEDLRKDVVAEAPVDSTLLTITAQATDPEQAAAIANSISEQLIAASPAIQGRQAELQASIDADLQATQDQIRTTQARIDELVALPNRTAAQETELATLEGRLVTLRSTYATLLSFTSASASNLLSIVEPAVATGSPVSPKPLLNTLLAALLGLMVAGALVSVLAYFDDTVKSIEDVAEVAGLSTLGAIAQMKGGKDRGEIYRLAALLYPRSRAAEAYRTLRTNIEFASVDRPVSAILVTSSLPGEGKTVTAANLAVVFAQAGMQVLLVDADLRKPGVHLIFDLANSQGLTTLLRNDNVGLDGITKPSEQNNLRILTTGPLPPNPAEILSSQRMHAVLDRLRASADLVILDSPPLQAVTDSAILSSLVDATILVIDVRLSRRGAVRRTMEALARAGTNTVGAVLNRIPTPSRSDRAAIYGDYYGSEEEAERRVTGSGTPALP